MAWLGEGLSSLRGQISNFTKEVLSEVAEAREEGCGHELQLHDAEEKIQHLESLCSAKDLEISKLREINAALETQASQFQYQSKKQQPLLYHVGSSPNLGGAFTFGDPGNAKHEATFDFSSMEAEKDDLVDYLRAEIRALKIEKEKVEKKMELTQKQCSCSETTDETTDKSSVTDGVSPYGLDKSEMFFSKSQKPEPPFNSERRMKVDDDITSVRNVPGIEPDSEKLMGARGECDGSEEMPKDVVKLLDQISKLTASLSDAQLNVNHHHENEKKLLREVERVKEQEFQAKESLKNLKFQLDTAQEYNYQLEQKLEELDKQNASTIEQLMSVVSSVKHENEMLQTEVKELEKKSLSFESELRQSAMNSKTVRREIELEMEKEVLKFIPPEMIPREPRKNSSGEVSVVVGAVKGLAKAFEEHRWKRDTIERKLTEVMKEAREVKAECLQLRGEIIRRDNSSLRTEGLAPILETGEEEDEDEESSDPPPKDAVQVVSDNAENRVGPHDGSELNWQKRCLALEEEIKRLHGGHVNLVPKELDLSDDDDEDDANGIEEVNDWTWQTSSINKVYGVKHANLDNTLYIKDGEHVITTITNDMEEVIPGDSVIESSASTKGHVPTLTEQYMKEKSKLENTIDELHEQKSILEAAQERSGQAIAEMENKMLILTKELDDKTKSTVDLLDREEELQEKIVDLKAKAASLEKLLAERDVTVKEFETEITSLRGSLVNERKNGNDMEKAIFELNDQISELGVQLRSREESLDESSKHVKILEDQHNCMMQSLGDEMKMKEDQAKLINELEEKMTSLQADFEQERRLGEEALKNMEEITKKNEDLGHRFVCEVRLKEEALQKLLEVEERFQVVEQNVECDMKSKGELSERIMDLERKLVVVEEEAKLDRNLKDEAVIRVSEQEQIIKKLEKELSVVERNLGERNQSILEHQDRIKGLEMERERIMCVVGDKAREISSLRSERQRLMEAMSSIEKMRQRETKGGDATPIHTEGSSLKDGLPDQTSTPPGEHEGVEVEDDGTVQLLAKLKSLQLESEQLAESYRVEQQRNKHLQNEVLEMLEKETALQDKLERLRMHLVSVEDRYTKEAVNAEEHIAFLKSKLTQVEERLHASSSAYTSASVRSNQQVESLENQIRALTEKKDESKNRLLAAEEQLSQQAKDLSNLQSVLEQFQKDKDREISVVKDKMGLEISSLENRCGELSEEIVSLKDQLQQAKEGLCAAARLSEQVDKKSEIITSLKSELKKLNGSLISAEEKLHTTSLGAEGKVDKNLVKNLLLGYLSSPAQGTRRGEVLRIIATILEFNKEEKERVNLGDGSGKGLGWLRGIAGWGGHHRDENTSSDPNQLSLSEAFIRFLESESKPKAVPPLHMIAESRTESTGSCSPVTGHSRSPSTSSTPPLLMSEPLLPTLPTFSVASGSNSSCILKDVLKDS